MLEEPQSSSLLVDPDELQNQAETQLKQLKKTLGLFSSENLKAITIAKKSKASNLREELSA